MLCIHGNIVSIVYFYFSGNFYLLILMYTRTSDVVQLYSFFF